MDQQKTDSTLKTNDKFKKSIGINLLISCCSCLLVIVCFEIFFRFFLKLNNATPTRPDKPKNWYLPESSIDNRDANYSEEKEAGVFRVIVIGDSFTYGGKVQFDDTLPKRLERMLNLNEKQRKVEVLNWGIPGYSSAQEVTLMSRAVKYYHPDLIILQITLNDAELEPFHVSHSAAYKRKEFIKKFDLFQYWHSLGYLARKIHFSLMEKEYVNYHKELFFNRETYGRFQSALKEMNRLSKEYKVPLYAAVFPFFSHPFNDHYPFIEVHQKINEELANIGITSVDLLASYKDIPPDRLQISPGDDAHPNEIAYRIAADNIYSGLLKNKLIPEDVIIKKISAKGRKLLRPLPKVTEKDAD